MTNITLSVEDSVYRRMKKYSEIRWSEFVRRVIKKRLNDLDNLESIGEEDESILTTLASQDVLSKDWDNELDERWNNV